eukprot:TRINITY_DN13844_c0_g1_i1.p1 TRINITY_DN13844_c0_g1~~TRINITY_DN13844_c0_g1_i1.p1  ORF type:complete len:176 (+),score=36.57 TRINITY_DN13844_c0_g1_i1:55-582(+)
MPVDKTLLRKVCVGTGSKIKIAAAQAVLPDAEVVAFPAAESGVPPQPVGRAQTETGAVNRVKGAVAHCPDACAWVAFENGMWPQEPPREGYVGEDAACVVLVVRNDLTGGRAAPTAAGTTTHVVWSEALAIPKDLPFKRGPNGEWSELKDPHAILTDGAKPRQAFLVAALAQLFA